MSDMIGNARRTLEAMTEAKIQILIDQAQLEMGELLSDPNKVGSITQIHVGVYFYLKAHALGFSDTRRWIEDYFSEDAPQILKAIDAIEQKESANLSVCTDADTLTT